MFIERFVQDPRHIEVQILGTYLFSTESVATFYFRCRLKFIQDVIFSECLNYEPLSHQVCITYIQRFRLMLQCEFKYENPGICMILISFRSTQFSVTKINRFKKSFPTRYLKENLPNEEI